MVSRSSFSRWGTDDSEVGSEREASKDSTSSVKPDQFALSKLMKVLLSERVESVLKESEMMIGRWSEERAVETNHSELMRSEEEAKEMSGEVGEPLEGSRVGVSSLRTPKEVWLTRLAMSEPLVSRYDEYQRSWWALKSPRMRQWSREKKGDKSGEKEGAQELDGGMYTLTMCIGSDVEGMVMPMASVKLS